MIFEVIGTPNEDDLTFITDEKAIEYIKSFGVKKPTNFKELYPAATNECIDFLNKTI